jgi:hypothetical protein
LRVASLIGLEKVAVVIVATDIADFGRGRTERTGGGLLPLGEEVDVVRFTARRGSLLAETLFTTTSEAGLAGDRLGVFVGHRIT